MENVKINGQKRTRKGTREARRLRREGRVPGNVYGHGGGSLLFSVSADEITPIIQSGQQVLEMDIDGDTELTLFQDVQWDTFGTQIQHLDLLRVNRNEKVIVDVPIEFRGIAPGSVAGGVLDQHLRSLSVECPAFSIPESIEVRIGELEIGDGIHVRDVEIDPGLTVQDDPDELVVQITEPIEEELPEGEEEGLAGPAEPELIGRAEGEDEESGEGEQ